MSKQLKIDEMLQVLHDLQHIKYAECRALVEHAGNTMAKLIGDALRVDYGIATFEGEAFAGTCCPFYAKSAKQERDGAPYPLDQFDSEEWGMKPRGAI